MEYLWQNSEGVKFRDVMEYFTSVKNKEWKKQTANTFLLRLTDKGLVRTESHYSRKTYFPNVTKVEYEKEKALKILNSYYEGSVGNFVAALAGGQEIDPTIEADLKRVLENK